MSKAKDADKSKSIPGVTGYAARTVRDLKRKFKEAYLKYGDGNVGLLPMKRRGNILERFSAETIALAINVIKTVWMTKKMKTKKAAYGEFLLRSKEHGVGKISYKKLLKLIKEQQTYEVVLNREGRRAAYKHEKFCYRLTQSNGRHGDRPWQVCHIDHTEVDLELKSHDNIKLGRAWVTFLMDAYSRRLLVVYVTFDPPSYRSCLMVIRECVRRHGRLPQTIVVDGGREFGSAYFELLLARYSIVKKVRPAAKARFGSVVERLFGTMNTQFVHTLLGSTKIMKNVRQVTKANNPKKFAVWTLEEFYVALCDWAYEKYDTRPHPSLGKSPREAYEESMAMFGSRPHRLIPYDDNFLMMTMPSTPKGTAKIDPNRGIKINGIYYWADVLFDDPKLANQQVDVRYDPFNRGIAYAHIDGEWVQCISEHFEEFDGRTEKEVQLRSEEFKRQRYLHDKGFEEKAEEIASDIRNNEGKERVMQQRRRDEEQKRVHERTQGETSQPSAPSGKEDKSTAARRPDRNRSRTADHQQSNLTRYVEF